MRNASFLIREVERRGRLGFRMIGNRLIGDEGVDEQYCEPFEVR